MIKGKKATIATIMRFPELYRRQAMQVIRDTTSTAVDTMVMAGILYFAENGREEEIPGFIAYVQKTVDAGADFYEDAVAEGLRNRLHNQYEIEYKR